MDLSIHSRHFDFSLNVAFKQAVYRYEITAGTKTIVWEMERNDLWNPNSLQAIC